jgi:tight adherence protein C
VRRLASAGDRLTVEQYRVSQVVWAVTAALPGAALLAVGTVLVRPTMSLAGAALVVAGLAGGVVARDAALSREIADRDAVMLAELPAVADLLSLAVSAGEGPLGALRRVSAAADSPLHRELRRVLDDVRSGVPLVQALDLFAARTSVAPLARFLDAVVVATSRGTPLADLLRSQAADVREAAKRDLIEAGGRKEISMMIPVVFLTLPTVVLFAAYPAFRALNFVAH